MYKFRLMARILASLNGFHHLAATNHPIRGTPAIRPRCINKNALVIVAYYLHAD